MRFSLLYDNNNNNNNQLLLLFFIIIIIIIKLYKHSDGTRQLSPPTVSRTEHYFVIVSTRTLNRSVALKPAHHIPFHFISFVNCSLNV